MGYPMVVSVFSSMEECLYLLSSDRNLANSPCRVGPRLNLSRIQHPRSWSLYTLIPSSICELEATPVYLSWLQWNARRISTPWSNSMDWWCFMLPFLLGHFWDCYFSIPDFTYLFITWPNSQNSTLMYAWDNFMCHLCWFLVPLWLSW